MAEVWECIAPGGLLKAAKIVPISNSLASDPNPGQEYAAFEAVRAARHPFLLGFERVEWVGDELIMVLELADSTLADWAEECQQAGLPGIPRGELLRYLADAAEALDYLADRLEVQHLDIKPSNLFLLSGRLKVGDFGLARKHTDATSGISTAVTPRYAAPEVLAGSLSLRADQYALAIVYQELLTGTLPFDGSWPRQLMLQHLGAEPDLAGLPPADRPVVARALAKEPDHRFRSCTEFLAQLQQVDPRAGTTLPNPPKEAAQSVKHPASLPVSAPPRRLRELAAVVPRHRLEDGTITTEPARSAAEVARIVAAWAMNPGGFSEVSAPSEELPGGSWRSEFWAKGGRADYERGIAALQAAWNASMQRRDDQVIRLELPASEAEATIAVEFRLPVGAVPGIVQVVGRASVQSEESSWRVGRLLDAARVVFQAGVHRRAAGRVLTDLRVNITPISARGELFPTVAGRCRDVSAGGVRFVSEVPLPQELAYLIFPDVTPIREWAILTRLLRRTRTAPAQLISGRYAGV